MTSRELLTSWGFPQAKAVGASEYAAIEDLLVSALSDCEPGTEPEFAMAILREFVEYALDGIKKIEAATGVKENL